MKTRNNLKQNKTSMIYWVGFETKEELFTCTLLDTGHSLIPRLSLAFTCESHSHPHSLLSWASSPTNDPPPCPPQSLQISLPFFSYMTKKNAPFPIALFGSSLIWQQSCSQALTGVGCIGADAGRLPQLDKSCVTTPSCCYQRIFACLLGVICRCMTAWMTLKKS